VGEEAVLALVRKCVEAQSGQREQGEVIAALLPCVRFPALSLVTLVYDVEANALLMAQPVTRVRPMARPPFVAGAALLHTLPFGRIWCTARHTPHIGTLPCM
jgi:hypothetical protein